MPKTVEPLSLSSLYEKLIKIGANQGREPWPLHHIQLAEIAVFAADVQGNPDADRPDAGTGRASVRGRWIACDRQRQQRCALMKAQREVPAPRGRQPMASATHGLRRGRSSLTWTPRDQTISLADLGTRGMLVHPLASLKGKLSYERISFE
jgi:hypothetical protein